MLFFSYDLGLHIVNYWSFCYHTSVSFFYLFILFVSISLHVRKLKKINEYHSRNSYKYCIFVYKAGMMKHIDLACLPISRCLKIYYLLFSLIAGTYMLIRKNQMSAWLRANAHLFSSSQCQLYKISCMFVSLVYLLSFHL